MSDIVEIIALVDEMRDRGEADGTIVTVLTEAAKEINTKIDAGRWAVGDLAGQVGKVYGTDRLGEFAADIGEGVKTVRSWHATAAFWNADARGDLFALYPTLHYSHYREIARVGNWDSALGLLRAAHENNWKTDRAIVEVKKALGKSVTTRKIVIDDTACITQLEQRADGAYVTFRLSNYPRTELISAYDNGVIVQLKGAIEVEYKGEPNEQQSS